MKLVLEVEDSKRDMLIELLERFQFVKILEEKEGAYSFDEGLKQFEEANTAKASELVLKNEIEEAVEYINLTKKGKFAPKPLKQLLHELQHTDNPSV